MGVLLHDENKLDGMNNILHHFMKYVPTLTREGEMPLPDENVFTFDDTKILFGGDQLTAARMRGTQALLVLTTTPTDRLEGVIPVLEDWHSRMALVDVSSIVIHNGENNAGTCILSIYKRVGLCSLKYPILQYYVQS